MILIIHIYICICIYAQVFNLKAMTVQIKVEKLNGKVLEFGIAIDDTIKLIKLNVQAEEGTKCACQRLTFGEEILEDENTLADYNIQNESTLHLIIIPTIRLLLCYMNGDTETDKVMPITILADDYLTDVERMLLNVIQDYDDKNFTYESEDGIMACGMSMYHNGKKLNVAVKVSEYDMQDDDFLVVTARKCNLPEHWYSEVKLVSRTELFEDEGVRAIVCEVDLDDHFDDERIEARGWQLLSKYPFD